MSTSILVPTSWKTFKATFTRNRSRPVEEFGGGLLVEAGFDGGTEPLVDGPFLQAAGF
jgi:hypothetical protein